MKRLAMFALLLGLTAILGCEPKKEKIQSNAPPADMTPATEPAEGAAPADGSAPADAPGEKPADESAK
jgi:hypothetical protein